MGEFKEVIFNYLIKLFRKALIKVLSFICISK